MDKQSSWRDLAITPGKVILQNELIQLIQYEPTTEEVSKTPLIIAPPWINKYYIMDLTPDKSLPNYLVGNGIQTFMISWRNPQREHADWGMDAYVGAIRQAIDVVTAVTRQPAVNILAACSGGMTAAILAGHCEALGEDVVTLDNLSTGFEAAVTTGELVVGGDSLGLDACYTVVRLVDDRLVLLASNDRFVSADLSDGDLALPRLVDVQAALNRLRAVGMAPPGGNGGSRPDPGGET